MYHWSLLTAIASNKELAQLYSYPNQCFFQLAKIFIYATFYH